MNSTTTLSSTPLEPPDPLDPTPPQATPATPATASAAAESPALRWLDVRSLGLRGAGWTDTARPFDRLPARAKGVVTESVWNLSRQSTGMWVDFRSNAAELHARCTLHHPPTEGQGYLKYLDLYARDADGAWRWAGVSRNGFLPSGQTPLVQGVPPTWRDWRLYLPLTYAVATLELGLPADAEITPAAPDPRPPIALYGTSIVHGCGHLSRPGMVWPSIVARRLDWPLLNLGFSGSARMEPPLAGILAELDPALFVIDPLPNMGLERVEENAEAFLRILLAARPTTPILLIEDRPHSHSWLLPDYAPSQRAKQAAYRRIADRLRDEGHPIHYLAGADLIGGDGEATTDGSHPSDLGAWRYADAVTPALAQLLAALPPS